MILIGEHINIMSQTIGPAMRERNPKPLQEMAIAEEKAGVDYLDINIGPARRQGDEMMEWIVKTVQEVSDLPLSLDTTNPVAMEAGLKVCKSKALINSISLARMDAEFPMVNQYDADCIGLLWGREGMPRDANERGAIAAELLYGAEERGVPAERIWFDPIATPVINIEANQTKPCLEFLAMLPDLAPGSKSTIGLSNCSNGAPAHLRPWLNRTFLMILFKYNIHSAIVDALDPELIRIARGERPDLVKLVHRMLDGEKPDLASLTEEEQKYAKTVPIFTGESLYSHSWLEV